MTKESIPHIIDITFSVITEKCSDEEEYMVSGRKERRWPVRISVRKLWKVAFEQWTERQDVK